MEEEKRDRGKGVDDGEDDVDGEQLNGSEELKVRKGTVRGATAKAQSAIVSPAVGYRIEGGGLSDEDNIYSASSSSFATPTTLIDDVFDLEGKDNDYKFYQTKFFNQEHHTLLCKDSEVGPCCVSLIHNPAKGRYRALVRTPQGNRRMKVKEEDVKVAWWRKLLRMGPSLIEVAKTLDPTLPANLRHVRADDLPAKILTIEEKQMIRGFKFGILYAKEGQTKEDEMFANGECVTTEETSPEFEEFLDFIADKVQLNKWTNFRAGLDVRSGTTGEEGLYIKWNNNEIMYHVSTMLPYNPKDKQQLERKRHIGNDIVIIVWQDGDTIYRPTTISSRQVHVAFVIKAVAVEEDPSETYYRMAVVSKDGVPDFGPEMERDALFKKGDEFKQYFYTKLLNAERASYSAPILGNKLTRTRTALLKDLAESYM